MACLSSPHIYITAITPNTITVNWEAVPLADTYQVEYKTISALTWTLLPTQTTTSVIIGGLTPSTEYLIRVNTVCVDESNCYSVTILNSTLD